MKKISKKGIEYYYYPNKLREYYLKNKDRVIDRAIRWATNNPEKRKKIVANNNLISKERKRKWHEEKYFGMEMNRDECINCGSKADLLIHHRDGNNGKFGKRLNNNKDNLVILCRKCHPKFHNCHWLKPCL